jgi:hypothetical protein
MKQCFGTFTVIKKQEKMLKISGKHSLCHYCDIARRCIVREQAIRTLAAFLKILGEPIKGGQE